VPAPSLQHVESAALTEVLRYWTARWDWESPTLFGLARSDYDLAVAAWVDRRDTSDTAVALALLGALREILYGASAISAEAIPSVCGLSRAELENLDARVAPWLLHVLNSGGAASV
jgi:hypothetical protein